MPRANEPTAKVFYKGSSEDFVVFVDGIEILNNWRKDRSIPLADVVNGFKIFVTHKYASPLYLLALHSRTIADTNIHLY